MVDCLLPSCAFLSLTSDQAAAVAIGQPNLISNILGAASASTLNDNQGDPFWDGTTLFIPDYGNNRVLGFAGLPTASGASATLVLGQGGSFTGSTAATSATALSGPSAVWEAGGKLFVSDFVNRRVLIYNTVPTGDAPADLAIGQPDLITATSTCAQNGLMGPISVVVVAGKVIVGDRNGNRVMIWNSVPTASGTNADLVLGQTSFITCTANFGGISATSLSTPTGVWSDGASLMVTDAGNARVLIWNSFPTANDQAADVVLGQGTGASAFTTGATGSGSAGFNNPEDAESNGSQVFVPDYGNNRVLVWNSFPTTNGQLPDLVLGQTSFAGTLANAGGAVGANTMDGPADLRFAGDGTLLLEDALNNRVLVYYGN